MKEFTEKYCPKASLFSLLINFYAKLTLLMQKSMQELYCYYEVIYMISDLYFDIT